MVGGGLGSPSVRPQRQLNSGRPQVCTSACTIRGECTADEPPLVLCAISSRSTPPTMPGNKHSPPCLPSSLDLEAGGSGLPSSLELKAGGSSLTSSRELEAGDGDRASSMEVEARDDDLASSLQVEAGDGDLEGPLGSDAEVCRRLQPISTRLPRVPSTVITRMPDTSRTREPSSLAVPSLGHQEKRASRPLEVVPLMRWMRMVRLSGSTLWKYCGRISHVPSKLVSLSIFWSLRGGPFGSPGMLQDLHLRSLPSRPVRTSSPLTHATSAPSRQRTPWMICNFSLRPVGVKASPPKMPKHRSQLLVPFLNLGKSSQTPSMP
mmetsp:Transcript_44991/g.141042  ORF Transcript_44991/g.141042 Transcript_44991/m.141042 type:complete len:321 (+) Transcript_44991:201-1163(+)